MEMQDLRELQNCVKQIKSAFEIQKIHGATKSEVIVEGVELELIRSIVTGKYEFDCKRKLAPNDICKKYHLVVYHNELQIHIYSTEIKPQF